MTAPTSPCQVLIAGAGPTGLVLALWLTLQGVKVRIVDKTAEPGTTSRALAVQARTLELYRQAGLSDTVVERGHKTPGANMWVKGKRVARIPLDEIGKALSPYAFMLIFPQDQHEKLLIERLSGLGVEVERRTELVSFEDAADGIVAHLKRADGSEETVGADYIAGCDGARSVVRHAINAEFAGGTYQQVFYVADVEAHGPSVNGELHIDLDEADFLAVFPMAGEGRARFIGSVRDDKVPAASEPGKTDAPLLTFEDVGKRGLEHMKVQIDRVNWFSTYRVHHRVTDRFRRGRAFLAGDAAHIHSPAGGQGMNTGIGDAINLAWKLAAVLNGKAPDALLDSYEAERLGFARRLVATTDRAFTLATSEGHLAGLIRTRIAPLLIPRIAKLDAAREFLFRTVGQLIVQYRQGPLASGKAGHVHGGDRLPWAPVDGHDNFESLAAIRWQVHVYGDARPDLAAWCGANAVPLTVLPWRPEYEEAGLAKDALYLLRPDSYVALADPSASPQVLADWFSARRITAQA
ncbi:MAG: FAD-dependent oxidoreductase [Caulobacter sp.]|nr:FAD-dependent oxidoreductase [Caulobacter sp.]